MNTYRTWTGRLLRLLAVCCMGIGLATDCNFNAGGFFPPPIIDDDDGLIIEDLVFVDLDNLTNFAVDPGLLVDNELVDVIVNPFEQVQLDIECFLDTVLDVDPILLAQPPEAAVNTPVAVQEGLDFLCGDTVTFSFEFDPFDGAFITVVFINGIQIFP